MKEELIRSYISLMGERNKIMKKMAIIVLLFYFPKLIKITSKLLKIFPDAIESIIKDEKVLEVQQITDRMNEVGILRWNKYSYLPWKNKITIKYIKKLIKKGKLIDLSLNEKEGLLEYVNEI